MIPMETEQSNIIRMIAKFLQPWLTANHKKNNIKEKWILFQSDYWIPGLGIVEKSRNVLYESSNATSKV